GNTTSGVQIQGKGTAGNFVQGNYIGTSSLQPSSSGNALSNGYDGVLIQQGATGNLIGGTTLGTGNVIAGNNRDGVRITGAGTTNNLVQGNFVGNVAPTNDVQTITVNGSPGSGTFTLSLGNQTTAPIPFNATSIQIASALAPLPGVGSGNVAATGGPL